MSKHILPLFLLTVSVALSAQTRDGNQVIFSTPEGSLRIQVCNNRMVRVTKSTTGDFVKDEPWMVIRYDFPPVDFQVGGRTLSTSALRLEVDPASWCITVSDRDGRIRYQETSSRAGATPGNECILPGDEHFFGFGERMDALDQRGRRIHLNVGLGSGPKPAVGGKDILRANYCPVPFFLSTRGYALFFHTAAQTDWDMGWTRSDRYSYSAQGGPLDYYVMVGDTPEQLLQDYQSLTGVSPLMPRAAFGLHLGSYSGGTWHHETEASQEYNVALAKRMRDERIPFDLLWLDSTWRFFNTTFGNGGCTFEFQQQFTDPQTMVDGIYDQHVAMFGLHIRSILDNGKNNRLLDDALKAGVTIPGARSSGIINFFDPKAVDWWWENAAMRIAKLGVKFVKTDVGSALRFVDGFQPQGDFSADELHNLFPIAYAKAPFERFAAYNGTRGFDHTREGYAGIQRYPFIWAGDWGTEWQWLEPVIRGGLNIALSGVGYWSHCMGGFEQYSDYDTDLWLRWCQFGMFSPVALLFGMDHPRYHEPWTYGSVAQRIFTKYDEMRYELLPYNYSNAWRMYNTSRPLMAPLLWDWFDDERTYNISDQFLFGESMMICPVTDKGALSRPVYFPGGRWIDIWTGERIEGRQYKSFLTPIDIMPIFIKEGAIIPRQPAMQWVGEKPADVLTLSVFPSASSSFDLYEDDGITDQYKQGDYAITHFVSTLTDGTWRLEAGKPEGKFAPEKHRYHIELWWDAKPEVVSANGRTLPEIVPGSDGEGWYYDPDLRRVQIQSLLDNQNKAVFNVK